MIQTYTEVLRHYIKYDRLDSLLSLHIKKIDDDTVSKFIKQFKGIDINIEIPDIESGTVSSIADVMNGKYFEYFLTYNRLSAEVLLQLSEGRDFTGRMDRSLFEIKLITDLVICGVYLRGHIESMDIEVKLLYNTIYGKEIKKD